MSRLIDTLTRLADRYEWGLPVVIAMALLGIGYWIDRALYERYRGRLKDSHSEEQRLSDRVDTIQRHLTRVEGRNEELERRFEVLSRDYDRLHDEWCDTRDFMELLIGKIQDDQRISWDPEDWDAYEALTDESDAFERTQTEDGTDGDW
jgi:predicted nuclease with TOPRIM domain